MKQRTWKKTAAFVLALMLVAAPLSQVGGEGVLFGSSIVAHAGTVEQFNPQVVSLTMYDDGSVETVTMSYSWEWGDTGYATDTVVGANIVSLNGYESYSYAYRGAQKFWRNGSSWSGISWDSTFESSKTTTGLDYVAGGTNFVLSHDGSNNNIRSITFAKGYLKPGETKTCYIYLWTKDNMDGYFNYIYGADGHSFYPDCILANVQSINGTLYYNNGDNTNVADSKILNYWTQNPVAASPAHGSNTALLSTLPKAVIGTVYYSLDNSTWSEVCPTAQNVNAGTHTVYYKVDEGSNYNELSGSISVTVRKADPTVNLPTDLTAPYGKTLADVELPDGWAWDNALTTSVGDAGNNTFSATFTPDDTDNYNTYTTDLTVTVTEIPATPGAVAALNATYGQTLADVALPPVTDGTWAWKDPTTSVGNAGGHEFTAVFTPTSANYSAVERTITVNVAKADPIYSDFRFTAPSNLTYDSNAKTANVTFNTQNGQYSGMGNITVKYFSDAACNTEVKPSDVKNAGTYYVGITVADNGANYNASTGVITSDSWKFVIAKANITPTVSIEGWTYGETAKTPSLGQNSNPGNGDVTYEYKKQSENDDAYSKNVPTNAGDYTVKATIAQTTNYNGGTATANFTINKADYSHSIKPTVKTNVIFNNEEQTLFVNPENLPEGATIEYRDFSNKTSVQMMISAFENNTNWSSEIPKATESGIYTYAYRIKGDSNHNSYPVTADLSEDNVGGFVLMGQINKAAPTYNAPVLQGTRLTHYSSDLLLIKTAGSVTAGQGTMSYALTENDAAPQTDAPDTWKTDISDIKATKAGTYYVWYKITGNNNYELAPAKADEVKVTQYTAPSKSSQTWTLTMDSYAYDGTAHTPTINGTTRGTVTYTYYNADTDEELDEAPSAIGNYKVKVYASGNNAYNSRSLIKTYSITDPIDKDGMANVDAFKANGTVPASDGKIFAGWFTDETCTTAYTEDTGKAYAKFIDENVLTVKAQISSGTTANSASTSIRFITSVDSLKYQNVGFKITCNGKTIDRKMTKVYTAINAGGAKVKPTVFSKDSRYMEAYTLKNITKDDYGKEFTVTPYYTTQDGTIVEGATNTFTIANMIK